MFLLKSHGPDIGYAQRLIHSFEEFNAGDLSLHVLVPARDVTEFATLESAHIRIHAEEDLLGDHLVTQGAHGLSVGYINQEIVKLAFWETGLAENYFCVDSDAVFIRPFTSSDFMRDETTPYSVLVQDKELEVEPRYYRDHWRGRERSIRLIMDQIGLEDPIVRTCHGHQVFSTRVLRSFVTDFLDPRGWSYADALALAPYEFSWYNMWLQKSQVIPIHAIEPLVKVFHNEDQHVASLLLGESIEDFARAYVAIVVNSNFSRDVGLVEVDGSRSESLAPYFSYGQVADLLGVKLRDTLRRRLGRSGNG